MGTHYFVEKEKGKIRHRGPVIGAGIGPPIGPQLKSGATEIEVRMCAALLDTGAGSCVINPSLAEALKLPVHAYGNISSASHSNVPAKIYIAALTFPPPLNSSHDFVQFLEAPRDIENHDIIIGRDILAHWHIVFDLDQGRYSISSLVP